jgi:hypothetical protein
MRFVRLNVDANIETFGNGPINLQAPSFSTGWMPAHEKPAEAGLVFDDQAADAASIKDLRAPTELGCNCRGSCS